MRFSRLEKRSYYSEAMRGDGKRAFEATFLG